MLQTVDTKAIHTQIGVSTRGDNGVAGRFSEAMAMIAPAGVAAADIASGYKAASLTNAALTGAVDSMSGTPYGNISGLSQSPFTPGGYAPPSSGAIGAGYSGSFGGSSVNASIGVTGELNDQQKFLQQNFLLDKMRSTNMEMIALQAQVQTINREFQIVSNILKSKHDTAINTIRQLRA